jgi:predicted DNA binding CopG/RHH family protein
MNKTYAFKQVKKPNPAPVDAWVNKPTADLREAGQGATITAISTPAEPMKRFTIDVAETLHKRIKSQCAMQGTKMADVIREMLEKAFPEQAA